MTAKTLVYEVEIDGQPTRLTVPHKSTGLWSARHVFICGKWHEVSNCSVTKLIKKHKLTPITIEGWNPPLYDYDNLKK